MLSYLQWISVCHINTKQAWSKKASKNGGKKFHYKEFLDMGSCVESCPGGNAKNTFSEMGFWVKPRFCWCKTSEKFNGR